MSAFEKIETPNGTVAYYRDEDHSYWCEVGERAGKECGKGRLAGVSTVSAPFDWRPDGLIKWATRLERDGVSELSRRRDGLEWLTDGDAVYDALKAEELLWSDHRNRAADRGTAVHEEVLEQLAAGEIPDLDKLGENRGYGQAVLGWWLEAEPTVIASEAVVIDLDLRVAGRLDLLCELDGRVAVVDAKTSKWLSPKFAAQLAGYAVLAKSSGYPAPEVGVILQVKPDGTHRAVEIDLREEDFLTALAVYRRNGELKRALR